MSCIFIFKYNDEVFNLLTERININHSYYGILQPSNSNNHVIYIYIYTAYIQYTTRVFFFNYELVIICSQK